MYLPFVFVYSDLSFCSNFTYQRRSGGLQRYQRAHQPTVPLCDGAATHHVRGSEETVSQCFYLDVESMHPPGYWSTTAMIRTLSAWSKHWQSSTSKFRQASWMRSCSISHAPISKISGSFISVAIWAYTKSSTQHHSLWVYVVPLMMRRRSQAAR